MDNSAGTAKNRISKITRHSSETFGLALILILYMTLGAAIRLFFMFRVDFPLNDGGMLFQMVRELEKNNFILPVFTEYNQARIPYAYPPLPFYLAGILEAGLGIELIKLELILPIAFNILAIPAFFDLSRQVLKRDYQTLHATLAFAIIPPAYEWLIMGGGLTRSPAFLFSILALSQFIRALKMVSWRPIILAILFTGLTGYCHMEFLWIAVIFMGLAMWFLARNRRGASVFIIIVGSVALFMAPYVLYVLRLHGIQPFLSALQSGKMNWLVGFHKLLLGDITREYLFTPILVFAILGFGRTLQTRDYLLPAWTIAIGLFGARSIERGLVIPLCLLVAIGLDEVILPGLANITNAIAEKPPKQRDDSNQKIFPNAISALLITYMMVRTATVSPLYLIREKTTLHTLSAEDRQAMQWIADHTGQEDSFLLLTPPSIWQDNEWMEWFPALAQHRSVLTVQGSEWLPDNRFALQEKTYQAFMDCIPQGLECIERVAQSTDIHYTHVYVSSLAIDRITQTPYTLPIASELRESPTYQVLYEQDGIVVYRRIK